MDSKGANYKVVLVRKLGGGKVEQEEVRRFAVEANLSSSFEHFSKKLSSIFPVLGQRAVTVTWLDSDGEEVTIKSDEELAIAQAEVAGPVCRLTAWYGVGSTDPDAVGDGRASCQGNAQGQVHQHVTCDGCESKVEGFRYKCIQCADYDLCGRCETLGLHAGHNMIRIASPDRIWPKHFFSRLGKIHDRMSRRESAASASAAEAFDASFAAGVPRVPGGFGGGCGWGRGGYGPAAHGPGMRWGGIAASAAADAAAMAGQAAEQAAKHAASHAAKHAEAVNAAAASAAKSRPGQEKKAEAGEKLPDAGDFLANIGQVVAAALDPFGINVQVGVEHGGKMTNVSKPKEGEEEAEAAAKAGHAAEHAAKHAEAVKEAGEKRQTNQDNVFHADIRQVLAAGIDPQRLNVLVGEEHDGKVVDLSGPKDCEETKKGPSPSSLSDEEEKDEFEWTVLNNSSPPPKEEGASKEEKVIPIKVGSDGAALYPELPKDKDDGASAKDDKKEAATATNPSAPPEAVAQHKDPKIQVALQAMMNMGFRDDGGWLTQLLESKGGDIGKVLDVLQPVAPVRK